MRRFDALLSNALDIIAERRRPADTVHFFHGTYEDNVNGVLNHGLKPGMWGGGTSDTPSDNKNFLGRDIGKALFYGDYIIEVAMNMNDQEMMADEDRFPIGEIPRDLDDEEGWAELRAKAPYLTDDDIEELRSFKSRDHNGQSVRNFVRRIGYKIPFDRKAVRDETGLTGNIMTGRTIGLKGRNRIVGAYQFERVPNQQRSFSPLMQCVKVIYNRGGTVQLGQQVRKAGDYA